MNARLSPETWFAAAALEQLEPEDNLRAWLLTEGLLTERVRAAAAARFALTVLHEGAPFEPGQGEHLRVIELGAIGEPWIYAETRVPAATLAAHPWLSRIGDASLGESLALRPQIRKSAFEYSRLAPGTPIVARAFARITCAARPLWVRRSQFSAAGAPFQLHEVFLPSIALVRAP